MPAQIPPLLYAISGTHTQRLPPENRLLTSGRGILKARNAWKRSAICLLLRGSHAAADQIAVVGYNPSAVANR